MILSYKILSSKILFFQPPANKNQLRKYEVTVFPALRMLPLSLLLFQIAACDSFEDDPTFTSEKEAPIQQRIAVQLAPVVSVEIRDSIIATGTTSALKTTNIKPMVSGLIEEVYVRVGDRVKKGQPLLRARQTEINLKIARLEHRITLARAELKNAKKDLTTYLRLSKTGVIPEEVADDSQTIYDIARARLGIAETQLLEAKQNLADSVSRAPFDGVITASNIEEGSFVTTMGMGMSMGGPPQNTLQVQQINIIVTLVRLPEIELSRIAVGTKAKITIDGLNKTFPSQIHVINDLIDYESRTIDVRLGINNEDYLIKPGLFARVEIFPEPRQILVVPRMAVMGYESNYVFVNNNGIAVRVPVTIRELDTARVEIIRGLSQGQSVIVGNNLSRLREGSSIQIREV